MWRVATGLYGGRRVASVMWFVRSSATLQSQTNLGILYVPRGGDINLAARLEGNLSLVRKELCQGTVSCPLVHSKVCMN